MTERSANEAFCTANPGVEYAVFLPDSGNVVLNTARAEGNKSSMCWLNIRQSTWQDEEIIDARKRLRRVTPTEEGYWAVLI